MSEYDAKRFIANNTSDRRVITPDTSEDPAPLSEYAVIDPVTYKTDGAHNQKSAEFLAIQRGHHVLIRNKGTYIPGAPPSQKRPNLTIPRNGR
jgi:hypothetical protein